jgi:hypothetical protein
MAFIDICTVCDNFLRNLINSRLDYTAGWHNYPQNALDLLSVASACTLRTLILSCLVENPVEDIRRRSDTTLEEALFTLPAGILRTTSVLIYYKTEETGGSCASISIHISDTMLSGRMAL